MHKLDKYVTSLVADPAENIARSKRSNYYSFNGHILRISDHIGLTSDGVISIILTDNDNQYVVHKHSNGMLKIMDYEDVKKFVKAFSILSDIFVNSEGLKFIGMKQQVHELTQEIEEMKKKTEKSVKYNTILGYPTSQFTQGQLTQIKQYIQQNTKK